MKNTYMFVAALMGLALILGACGKKSEVDTAPLESSFADSEPTLQSEVNKVVSAVQSQDYAGALATLQKLAANVELTDAQKKAVQDVLAQVQKVMADTAQQAVEEADKAVEGLKNALPKK